MSKSPSRITGPDRGGNLDRWLSIGRGPRLGETDDNRGWQRDRLEEKTVYIDPCEKSKERRTDNQTNKELDRYC